MIDGDGFEIPDEYLPLATDDELAKALSLSEYNIYINLPKRKAKRYKELIIKRNLWRINGKRND